MIPPLMIRDIPAYVGAEAIKSRRQLWFPETGEVDTPIYDRRWMPLGFKVVGPTVIESLESTILVPPRWQANVTEDGFVVVTRLPHG
jgi:N-methylhydantoinase A